MARNNEMQTAEELRPGYKVEVSNLETNRKEYICVCKFRDWINENTNDPDKPFGVQYYKPLDPAQSFLIQSIQDTNLIGVLFEVDDTGEVISMRGRTINMTGNTTAPTLDLNISAATALNINISGLNEYPGGAAAYAGEGNVEGRLYVDTSDNYALKITSSLAE